MRRTAVVVCLLAASVSVADEVARRRDAAWLAGLTSAREALEWSDVAIRQDWRLQRRAVDGACRILDPRDGTAREGTPAECAASFAELVRMGTIPQPVGGPTVIVLHGLGEGRSSMRPLVAHLRRSLRATVLSFGYASTHADIDAHGRALGEVIAGLPRDATLSFVGHSLGNLVVRRWMNGAPADDIARTERMVMLGPPNQGSQLARRIGGVELLAGLAHGAARDLVVDWERVSPRLAVPPCDFGIIAGGKGDAAGFSPLLDGDDDAIVSVAETRLEGADDFLVVPVHHAAMMRHPEVQRATGSFLEAGRFGAAETAGSAP